MGVDGPMTTSAELAEAADTDPEDALVGERITDRGHVRHDRRARPRRVRAVLDPGPAAELEPYLAGDGVYWFGVHALGSNDAGGDAVADGRARTFLPLVPPTQPQRSTPRW